MWFLVLFSAWWTAVAYDLESTIDVAHGLPTLEGPLVAPSLLEQPKRVFATGDEALKRATTRSCCAFEPDTSTIAVYTSEQGLGARCVRLLAAELFFRSGGGPAPRCIAFTKQSSIGVSSTANWIGDDFHICHQMANRRMTKETTFAEWLGRGFRCYRVPRMRRWLSTFSECRVGPSDLSPPPPNVCRYQESTATILKSLSQCSTRRLAARKNLKKSTGERGGNRRAAVNDDDNLVSCISPDCASVLDSMRRAVMKLQDRFVKWRREAALDRSCGYLDRTALHVAIHVRTSDANKGRRRATFDELVEVTRKLAEAAGRPVQVHVHSETRAAGPTQRGAFFAFDEFPSVRFHPPRVTHNDSEMVVQTSFFARNVDETSRSWHFVLNSEPTWAMDCLAAADVLVLNGISSFSHFAAVRSSGLKLLLIEDHDCRQMFMLNQTHDPMCKRGQNILETWPLLLAKLLPYDEYQRMLLVSSSNKIDPSADHAPRRQLAFDADLLQARLRSAESAV